MERPLEGSRTRRISVASPPAAAPANAESFGWKYLDDDTKIGAEVDDPSHVTDFMFVFFTLEKTILYGLLSCIDSFLFTLVILPIRGLIAVLSLLRSRFRSRSSIHPIEKVDLAKFILILVGWFCISWMNIGAVSGYVRQETLVKLKILFTLLELLDKLMGNYGEHILGSLFWALEARPELVKRGIAWHALLALGYIAIHSHIVILHCSVFDAAMNGKSQALLTLLLLIQFAEMKATAMKKISESNLGSLCYEDILERFQLIIYMFLLFAYNCSKHLRIHEFDLAVFGKDWMESLLSALLLIYSSELIVDWVKHTTVCNYNHYAPRVYAEIENELKREAALLPHSLSLLTNRSGPVSKRMGLWPLPLATVFLKVLGDWMPKSTRATLGVSVLCFAVLFVCKIVLGAFLQLYVEEFPPPPPRPDSEKEKEKDKGKDKDKEKNGKKTDKDAKKKKQKSV